MLVSRLEIRMYAGLLAYCLLSPSIYSKELQPIPISQIIKGIRDNHDRMLHIPGGIGIRYHVDVKQDPNNPVCVFHKGFDASLNIRWPELRSREEGLMGGIIVHNGEQISEISRPTIREGSYDFETMAGVAHDSEYLGQIVNYRHAFSSNAHPLLWQFYVEMDQYYVPGEAMKTDYWLPNALEQHPYELAGEEVINGVPCQILKRPNMDTIWIATKRGFVVCRREFNYGLGQPLKERVQNLDLKEVSPGIWVPLTQIRDTFDLANPRKLLVRYVLKVNDVNVGNLTDTDVRVVLSDKISRIEDYIAGKVYTPASDKTRPLDESISRFIYTYPGLSSRRLVFLSFLGLNILVGYFIIRIKNKPIGNDRNG
jgi:hypothetical protein